MKRAPNKDALLPAFVMLLPARRGPGSRVRSRCRTANWPQVRGADGISFAVDLNLNRQPDKRTGDSRLIIGQKVDGA
jgi:hypothetical protein